MMGRCKLLSLAWVVAAAGQGCATGLEAAEAPVGERAAAHTPIAVRHAQTKQAESYLLLGEQGLAQARQLAAAGERVAGRTCIMRAQTDAELALLLAPEPAQQQRAQELLAAVRDFDEACP